MTGPVTRRGFSVRVFLPDGEPDGVKVVEKSNWTGCGLVVPRALFAGARTREEIERAGVYFLVGPRERSPLPQVYVGEGDPVRPRLEHHAREKDFWTHAVIFTTKDKNLNKAHVQRLESRLIDLAKSAKRCVLENAITPQPPSLSDAETADVDGFLDDLLLCLPVLGYSFFEVTSVADGQSEPYEIRAKGIEAHGLESADGFVVRTRSRAVKEDQEAPSIHAYVRELRAELVRQTILIDCGSAYEFSQDYTFGSPSTAAAVVLGRSANGRTEWKTTDGRTLREVQEANSAP